jgi:biopolymer transport protein TolR
MKVDLPQARAARPLNPKEPIVVVVGKDGKLALGAEQIDPADLVQLVKLKMGDDPARVVHLRGDKEAPYGRMVAVLDELATNGITHIAIVTESGKAESGKALAPAPAPEPGK